MVTLSQSRVGTLLCRVAMNTSVSPLPIPVWPLLGLSLALVSLTTAAVTFTSARATQQMRAQAHIRSALEAEAPILLPRPVAGQTAHRRALGNRASSAT